MEKEITYKSETGASVKAFIASHGEQGVKLPAIILVHEIFGLDNHIRDVARRLAKEGYLVIAPHLMYGELEQITDPALFARLAPYFGKFRVIMNDPAQVKDFIAALPDADRKVFTTFTSVTSGALDTRFLADLKGAFAYLTQNESVKPDRIASMGFCFGGGMAGLLSVNIPEMAAHIIFYGKRPAADKIMNITAPVLGLYGQLDQAITSQVPALAEDMKKAGKRFKYVIYDNAMHAFFNDTRAQVYNKEAAGKAWEEAKAFLREAIGNQ